MRKILIVPADKSVVMAREERGGKKEGAAWFLGVVLAANAKRPTSSPPLSTTSVDCCRFMARLLDLQHLRMETARENSSFRVGEPEPFAAEHARVE